MKKYILSLVVFFCITTLVFAQKQGDRKNRMESYRIAYITEKLDLTPDEAQRFWPIYNQFRDELKKIHKDTKGQKAIADMTDSEAENAISGNFEREEKVASLKKEYVKKLKGIIAPKKIAQLQQVEQDFKKEVLERMKERRKKD
jgi:hypothetical protein